MRRPHSKLVEAAQLLSTKFYPPKWQQNMVSRRRLVDCVDIGVKGAVTVVSAPAGSGKSTLLAEWMHTSGADASWVSLDHADNDASLFWAYVIAALQRFQDGIGDLALAMHHSMENVPMESILSTLINDIDAAEAEMIVVLDDYHVIEQKAIHDGMSFFIDHMPPHLHLVLVSRTEPPLPLARLRGQGKLTEIPATDLRFTLDEAVDFLSGVMKLPVTRQSVAELEHRTEGWIAGLKLAALSMQGRKDVDAFMTTFSGDHRYIADFLVEEVLDRQSADVRDFLLQTAHLQRLCGPLCDAVMDRSGSAEMLAKLEQQHLFLVPLDDTRYWYRYHHLFGDVVATLLESEKPVLVPALHRRASAWFESEGHTADAIRHTMAAKDVERAADLVERSWRQMDRSFQAPTWLSWAEDIPKDIISQRPVLSTGYGWALLDTLQFDRARKWIDRADALLDPACEEQIVVADETEYASLPATIAAARAYLAQARGDAEETEQYARRTLELLPEDDHFYRAIPLVILGLAEWRRGDLDHASASMRDALQSFERADNVVYALRAHYALAELDLCRGALNASMAAYERAAMTGSGRGGPHVVRGMASVLLERGDLDGADSLLKEDPSGDVRSARWHQVMADIACLRDDIDGALAVLDAALSAPAAERIPTWRPAAAHRARVLLLAGRIPEATVWAHGSGYSLEDIPTFTGCYGLATYARWCMATGGEKPDAIKALLGRISDVAERSCQTGLLIDVDLLEARLAHVTGDDNTAWHHVERALERAAPEAFVAPFLRESDLIGGLLPDMVAKGSGGAHAVHVLRAMALEPKNTSSHALPDALSPRELEVLRLIAAGLRNQDIADQLFISLATVKRHIANIYGKLEASHRTDAIVKATEAGIL